MMMKNTATCLLTACNRLARIRAAMPDSPRHLAWLFFVGLAWALPLIAAETPAGKKIEPPSASAVCPLPILPINIAPTVAIRTAPVEVYGTPRIAKGHPCTLWDEEDVHHYKDMLKTSKELQLLVADLRARMDDRISKPIIVPPPQKGPDGNWLFPGDYFPPHPASPGEPDPVTKFRIHFSHDAEDVSDLGILYALTGEEKYALYAKKILLSYAVCSSWGAQKRFTIRNNTGQTGQLLDEALMMTKFANGYDLIYNHPAWTPAEHTRMHDEFFRPIVSCCIYPRLPEQDQRDTFASQVNNRGAIGSCAVLMAGYVTGDQELVNAALYGVHCETKSEADWAIRRRTFPLPQDWIANTAEKPSRGLLTSFFAQDAIPGGMWVEGTPSYAFYALGSLIDSAEIAWHHGIDLYRHNNAIFKNMFDFPLLLGYPDLSTPGLNDSHREYIMSGFTPTLYEYAYRRYKDRRYLAVINSPVQREYMAYLANTPQPDPTKLEPYLKGWKSVRHLNITHVGSAPPSLLFDLDPQAGTAIPPSPSANYPEVGFGILRTPSVNGTGPQNLILCSGPCASHGHPDKLQIDLYALGDVLMPSPGIDYPYTTPRIPNWYGTTIAHNTLTVDESTQVTLGSNPRTKASAVQVIYAPASTMGIQRAWTGSVYPDAIMDRSVFMTTHYLADLFAVSASAPHTYDLAWHIRGKIVTDLPLESKPFPEPVAPGYNTLTAVRQAVAGDKPWNITFNQDHAAARLLAAGSQETCVIIGESGFYADLTCTNRAFAGRPTAPTVIERRAKTQSALYGNALDYSNSKDGYVKSIVQTGGPEAGYGLLQVTTTDGTDLCFTAYRPGTNTVEGLETDALQAFVQRHGTEIKALYLAGGKTLKIGDAFLTRSEAGLTYLETGANGNWILGNPSPDNATVIFSIPKWSGGVALLLDENGKKGAQATLTKGGAPHSFAIQLKAGTRVELVGK